MSKRWWITVLLLVPVCWVIVWFVGGAIALLTQGSCNRPTTPDALIAGQTAFGVLLVLVLGPWLAAAVHLRQWRLVPFGLAASWTAVYLAVDVWTSTTAEWTGFNICF